MSTFIKAELIKCLEALQMPELKPVITSLRAKDFSKESDINAALTRFIYVEVLTPYSYIMNPANDKKSEKLRNFIDGIGPINAPKPKMR